MAGADCCWYSQAPNSTAERSFIRALEALKIEVVSDDPDPQMAAVLWLGSAPELTPSAEAIISAHEGRAIIVADELKPSQVWRLAVKGVVNVISSQDSFSPARIAALLLRLTEIDRIISLPLVRSNLIGTSKPWRRILRRVIELARFTDTSLLITGESGTGKELIARLLHTLDQRATKGQLITMDCTTVSPELSGSEFFGHERGSFTTAISAREGVFSLADGGTLFLDEIGELPISMQAELLRVTQERTYKRVGGNTWKKADFRLVCATNRDLRDEQRRGNFRLDFYHRIASATVHLPPLRERREDILPLARHFLKEACGEEITGFAPSVEAFLTARDYPGNVRELRQLIQRIGKSHVGPGPIDIGDIPDEERLSMYEILDPEDVGAVFQEPVRRAIAAGHTLPEIKELAARVAMDVALRDSGGNAGRAAERLGVSRRAVELRRAGRRDA